MKRYIGIKTVNGKAMTFGDFCEFKLIKLQEGRFADEPGYFVQYEGGYESWSPKDVWDKHYFEISEDANFVTDDMIVRFMGPVVCNQMDSKTTHVSVETLTGFVQHEVSSCVDSDNYDTAIGERIATERIKANIRQYFGFALQWALNGLKR